MHFPGRGEFTPRPPFSVLFQIRQNTTTKSKRKKPFAVGGIQIQFVLFVIMSAPLRMVACGIRIPPTKFKYK